MAGGCPRCGQDVPNFFVGDVLYPPDENGNITLPAPEDSGVWNGTGGNGIDLTPGGATGNEPEIAVCLNPDSDNAIRFVNGCLDVPSSASSPEWVSPNDGVVGGIRVIAGGQQGHGPTFLVVVADNSPVQGSYNANGELVLECCDDLPFLVSSGENVVVAPGDNPLGAAGNGHRPSISMREGSGLCDPLRFECVENADGTFEVSIVNPETGGSISLGGPF